jgi:beta-lactam-binding protein with PASTA domain
VPDVAGLTRSRADRVEKPASSPTLRSEYSDSVEQGRVIETSPPTGTLLDAARR